MIADVKEFEKKLIDQNLNRKQLAKKIGITPATLSAKLERPESEFKLSEMVDIANATAMTNGEFLSIFFGRKLSLNESSEAAANG